MCPLGSQAAIADLWAVLRMNIQTSHELLVLPKSCFPLLWIKNQNEMPESTNSDNCPVNGGDLLSYECPPLPVQLRLFYFSAFNFHLMAILRNLNTPKRKPYSTIPAARECRWKWKLLVSTYLCHVWGRKSLFLSVG